jgi:hypothetical protein
MLHTPTYRDMYRHAERTITLDHVTTAFLFQNRNITCRVQGVIEITSPDQEPPLQVPPREDSVVIPKLASSKNKLLSPETPLYQSRSLKARQVSEFPQQ